MIAILHVFLICSEKILNLKIKLIPRSAWRGSVSEEPLKLIPKKTAIFGSSAKFFHSNLRCFHLLKVLVGNRILPLLVCKV